MERAESVHATEATAHTLGCGTHLAMGTCVMQSGESEKVTPGSHATHGGWEGFGRWGVREGFRGGRVRGRGEGNPRKGKRKGSSRDGVRGFKRWGQGDL